MISYIETDAEERIEVLILDDALDPLTGKTDIVLTIRRVSDGQYLDFNDMTFKGSLWTTREQVMTEVDATYDAGAYYYDFDTSAITNATADDTYELRVEQDGGTDARNVPQVGTIRVASWIDDITTITGKLPTNFIMGSGVQTDKDDEIDDIKTSTDNLPADPASEANVDANEAKIDTAIAQGATIIAKTNNLPADPASETNVDANETKIDALQTSIDEISEILGGRWLIDESTNQLILYESDNTTEIMRFDLKDINGLATHINVYERVRV